MAGQKQIAALNFDIDLRTQISTLVLAVMLAATILLSPAAQAQTFTVIHNFTGGADGATPGGGLTLDAAGNLYGTASYGGLNNGNCDSSCGVVFKMKPVGQGWVLTPLYDFTGGSDGANPDSGVIFGPNGTLYGATAQGGGVPCQNSNGYGCGTVFTLRPHPSACNSALCPWTETVLYRFAGGTSDGAFPGQIVFDPAGNLYGTTFEGGVYSSNCAFGYDWCGTVFELTPSHGGWTESLPWIFTGGDDGATPIAGLTLDAAGNLYGAAEANGAGGSGTIFELTRSGSGWTENTLYSFSYGGGLDASFPRGTLIFDPAGNLYGTTLYGGGSGNDGTVFEMTPSGGTWNLTQLYGLHGFEQNGPAAGVVRDSAGNLYGTASELGPNNAGLVFKLTPSNGGWIYTLLHQFEFSDGCEPEGSVVLDAHGNIYGTASACGANGVGVVWEITP